MVARPSRSACHASRSQASSVRRIPVIRRKVEEVLERAGFSPNSHDGRDLLQILETYPRDELFRLGVDELAELALAIVAMGQRRRVRLFVSRDHLGCFASCLVFFPRDRYTTPVRVQVLDILRRAFGGTDVDFNLLLTESVMARLHVVVSTPNSAAFRWRLSIA